MKVIVFGNAGAGKTTLAKELISLSGASRLSLDELAFSAGAERRPLADSIADAVGFIGRFESWIIEGCYADIITPLLEYCEVLVFMNPGVDTCIDHCKKRPWESEKFESSEAQDANLDNLLAWVREYETRADEYGLVQHKRLFDSFRGRKIEFTTLVPDAARQVVAANP